MFSKPMMLSAFLPIILLSHCASAPKVADRSEIKLDENSDNAPIALVPVTSASGLSPYKHEQNTGNSQWIKCTGQKNRGSVLAFHRFSAGFDPKAFCSGWIAQVFVKNGFQVIAVNRPSYVESTGTDDLSGPASIAAVKAGLAGSGAADQLVGVWGYDTGTIAAAFFAKQMPKIQWLILGGGIYDLEVTARGTIDTTLQNAVTKLKAVEGDAVFERRSIAWDFNGLPKTVALYHAKGDTFAPMSQADAFNSQLRTAEFKVFRNEVANATHELPWRGHMSIVEQALQQVAPIKQK